MITHTTTSNPHRTGQFTNGIGIGFETIDCRTIDCRTVRFRTTQTVITVALVFVMWMGMAGHSVADEPAEAFVTALTENGYFDVALDYLEGAATDELVDPEYRQRIPFEKAEVLILSIPSEQNAVRREEKLNNADRLLAQYSRQLTDPDQQLKVIEIGANIKIKRAESYIAQSANNRLADSQRQELLSKAEALLGPARQQYQQARQSLRQRIENFLVDPEDPKSLSKKKRLQASYIRIRTKLPLVTELIADTMPPGTPQQKQIYVGAMKENQDVYKDYENQGAVFVFEAAINGARAAQKAGDHKTTLSMLESVFFLGDGPAENRLKKDAMLVAADSWNATKPYPFESVVQLLEKPIGRLNRNEVRTPDWQRLQLEFGKAQLLLAQSLKTQGGGNNAAKARDLNRESSKLIRSVARTAGPYRDDARSLIERFKLSFAEQPEETDTQELKTFVDARDKGTELITEVIDLHSELTQAKRELASTKAPNKRSELQSLIDQNTQDINRQTDAALAVYETALALTDDATTREDINFIHYQRSVSYFFKDQPLPSAIIAEFLLDRYPTVNWSKQASAYIVNGYASLLESAPKDDRDFETEKLKEVCRKISSRWAGSDEASRAAGKLTEIALKNSDLETAQEFFDQISDSWPSKTQLAAALGQRLWFKFRTADNLSQSQRKSQLAKIEKMLDDSINSAGDDFGYATANSALALVSVLLEQNRFDAALKQLESATVAPMKLINQNHRSITDPRYAAPYRRNTYLTALKTYLAVMGTGSDFDTTINKATEVIGALKSELESSNDPKAMAKLTAIYQNVAKTLKTQFESLTTLDQRKSFAASLAKFLGTVEKQSTDAPTVLWAGSTLLDTASSLAAEGAQAEAAPMFTQAVSALDRAEKIGITDEKLNLVLRQQKALALRGSGDFQAAVDAFIELLKVNSAVNLQVDAAETLQMWGKAQSDKTAYAKAMMGTGRFKDGKREKNAVWGWRKLVQATRGKESFNDVYRESLYNSVKSRFEYGVLISNKKAIASSLSELEKSFQRFPFLRAGVWVKKFDDLVADIKENL